MVERAAALQRGPLDLGVPADPQQQGHVGQPVGEHAHGAPQHVRQAVGGRALGRLWRAQHALEPVERLVQREAQQLLLGGDVVVDRRLREPQPLGEHPDGGRVVPVLIERGHGDLEDAALVVAGASSAQRVRIHRVRHPFSLARRTLRGIY
ncbi:hypothetical protein A0130_06415 [Leifsonia xyli]|nr:hypothetical protein A0130_06415 [Leifsonia xyli]